MFVSADTELTRSRAIRGIISNKEDAIVEIVPFNRHKVKSADKKEELSD